MTTKYEFTTMMDEAIRRAYRERPTNGAIPGVRSLSEKWDIPTWTIKRRAGKLGLTREKNAVWTEKEIELLEQYAHLPPSVIEKKFLANWFFRSAAAIKIKLLRFEVRRDAQSGDYTPTTLGMCFGTDQKVIVRWINLGLLKATVILDRADGQKRRIVKEADIIEFIRKNPMTFDIRKVDQMWFVDLLLGGKVGYTVEKAVKF